MDSGAEIPSRSSALAITDPRGVDQREARRRQRPVIGEHLAVAVERAEGGRHLVGVARHLVGLAPLGGHADRVGKVEQLADERLLGGVGEELAGRARRAERPHRRRVRRIEQARACAYCT